MKFADEAKIHVEAGDGGNGACSFLRLKFMPMGGPDGGDGGDGGSIFLLSDESINTLIDYRYTRTFKAENGEKGSGQNSTGKNGKDLILKVPVGTLIYDDDTDELIADLSLTNQTICVAQGGKHGVGNARFKSSINRSPRRTIPGKKGEIRNLRLELKILADVGLVGLPNAGKSTLIAAVSEARPKIADYPFTTLYPYLGVVRVEKLRSFILADLPGLIEGAAEGAGLGIRFLKHISRTRLLFHVVDASSIEEVSKNITIISKELEKYDSNLESKERWLVLNKIDLIDPADLEQFKLNLLHAIPWKGPVFFISGLTRIGLDELIYAAMNYLEKKEEI